MRKVSVDKKRALVLIEEGRTISQKPKPFQPKISHLG